MHNPVSYIFQEKVPSGMMEYVKIMSGLRFELEKQKKIFLMPSAEPGGLCGGEAYMVDKILLS